MLTTQTEYTFRSLLEAAPDAMVIVDDKGKIELVNAQTEKLFGYSRTELVGNKVEVLIPARFTSDHVAKRSGYTASPEVREMGSGMELYARRKNGSEFMVEIALSYLKSGDATKVCAAVRDITERKLLEKQKAQLASIVEFSNDAIIGKSIDRIITQWNSSAEQIFGYTANEVLGKHVRMLIPPEYRQDAEDLIEQVLSGKTTRYKETLMLRKNGERFIALVTCSPIKDALGTITGISKIVRDITQVKANQEKIILLNNEMKDLEEKLRYHKQLEDFAYITSHNLRSPVGNLNSLLAMYDGQTTGKAKDGIVEKLHTVTRRLSNTLNELSKALSIKTDIGIVRDKILFDNVFEAIIDSCGAQIEKTKANITHNFKNCEQISYPSTYIESIMLNLLTNALKYSSPDRVPEIVFETFENKTKGKGLKVSDNGLGIDLKRYGKKIFGLHKTFHRNEDARGVGLFITKAQIEAMGGSITVESEPDKGTVFTIFFNNP